MANFFGSIKRLVSMVFLEDGQDITVEPNNSITYTGATIYELPPKAAGTEILVGTTAAQTLSNKALVVPTFSGGAIDIPAGSTIGGSAIGGSGGGASTTGNNIFVGSNTFSDNNFIVDNHTVPTKVIQLTSDSPFSAINFTTNTNANQSVSISPLGVVLGSNSVFSAPNVPSLSGSNNFTTVNTFAEVTVNGNFINNSTAGAVTQIESTSPNSYLKLKGATELYGADSTRVEAVGIVTPSILIGPAATAPLLANDANVARTSSPQTFTASNTFSGPVDFTSQLLPPPDATASGVTGNIRYNTTINKLEVYTGAGWETITSI
jgi:hypothetical protein